MLACWRRRSIRSRRRWRGRSARAGPRSEPVLLRVHRHPKGRTLELFGTLQSGDRAVRAVPPLLDAPGDRGGLHPRRARQLHDLQDLLGSRRRSPTTRSTTPTKARRAIARFVSLHPAQPRAEGRDHRRALPPAHRQGRSAGRRRRWSSPPRACTPSATSRPSTSTSPSRATTTQGAGRVLRQDRSTARASRSPSRT